MGRVTHISPVHPGSSTSRCTHFSFPPSETGHEVACGSTVTTSVMVTTTSVPWATASVDFADGADAADEACARLVVSVDEPAETVELVFACGKGAGMFVSRKCVRPARSHTSPKMASTMAQLKVIQPIT